MKRAIFEPDHEAFRESCRTFVDRTLRPNHEKHMANHGFGREVWLELGKQGFLGLNVPEEYGGAGVDDLRYSLILAEELCRLAFSYPSCVGIHTNCIAPYLVDLCTEEQKQRWLPGFCTGELITALAMTEASGGSDLAALKTRAVRDGEDWVLNGSKTFITNGQHANLVIVVAKTDPKEGAKGISLMVIETDDAAGFRRGRKLKKLGMDWADTSELFFEDVKLPAEGLLGTQEGQGFIQLMTELPQERVIVATAAIGMIERALTLTIDYVKERQAFGKKIIEFQNTQFVLAECKSEATIGKVFHDHCVERHVRGELDTATASMAKYWLTDLQNSVVDHCLQLFGGYGYMDEYPISRMYRDARVQRIYAGTNEIMKLLIARGL